MTNPAPAQGVQALLAERDAAVEMKGRYEVSAAEAWSRYRQIKVALAQARREYGAFGTLSGETLVQIDTALQSAAPSGTPSDDDISDASSRRTSADRSTVEQLRQALEESVKLQSHYAELLNMYDGGQRRQFATAKAWIDRLAETRKAGR